MLSRAKPAVAPTTVVPQSNEAIEAKKKAPKLETFIEKRDYIGAITILEVQSQFRFVVCIANALSIEIWCLINYGGIH